jgi:FG-GAP-like repeat/RTX calcium-binding nonapeptide repeat (4 copies)
MVGGIGNDTYTVDSASDVIIEIANEGTDAAIVFANNYTLAPNVENGTAGLTTGQTLTGNGLANTLVGNTGDDILDGGGGLDQLAGDGGYDTFVFAAGEADGDAVLDFSGNGALAGDSFRFVGFGTAAGGATFTQIGATQWQIHSGRDGHNEVITLPYGASVHTSDYVFQDALGNSAPVATAGDFNGDGKADILWQHDSGLPVIWTMHGTTITNSSTLPNPEGPAWHVAATADFNGDGKSDILLQNADSGLPSIWTMDGTTITNGAALPNPGEPAWHVVAAADFNGAPTDADRAIFSPDGRYVLFLRRPIRKFVRNGLISNTAVFGSSTTKPCHTPVGI